MSTRVVYIDAEAAADIESQQDFGDQDPDDNIGGDEAAVAARSDGAVTIAVGQQLPPPPAEPFQPPPPRGQRGAGLTLSSR